MNRTGILPRFCLASLFAITSEPTAHADILIANITKPVYALCEPIVVHITLHLVEPYRLTEGNPLQAAREARRAQRSLRLQLYNEAGLQCESPLGAGGFAPVRDARTELRATTLGILGNEIRGPNESRFRFWDLAGKYWIVVIDRDNGLESNRIPLTLERPEGINWAASEWFASGGLATFLAILSDEYSTGARELFERLEARYPGTVYGKYARACLRLNDAWSALTGESKLDAVERTGLIVNLHAVEKMFDPGHPIRNRALYYIARLESNSESHQRRMEVLEQLKKESKDDTYLHLSDELEYTLKRVNREQGRTPVP